MSRSVYIGVILILIIILTLFLILFLKNKFSYFSEMDFSQVFIKNLKIPAEDININAKLVFPKYIIDANNRPQYDLPLIFINHGWGMNIDQNMLIQYACALAISGPYACLLYDCRGHGKTGGKKRLSKKLFDDIPKIIDFAENLSGIDSNKMGFIGMSMGGEIALTRAYVDKRLKAVVSICSPNNAKRNFTEKPENLNAKLARILLKVQGVDGNKISDETNMQISPEFIIDENREDLNSRVFLIIARDDSIINFEEFLRNKKQLHLNDSSTLVVSSGNHTFFHQELLIFATAVQFFKRKLI